MSDRDRENIKGLSEVQVEEFLKRLTDRQINVFERALAKRSNGKGDINPEGALTIDQICALDNFGRGWYFRMRDLGLGPEEMRAGKKILISPDARKRWHAKLEKLSESKETAKRIEALKEHARKAAHAFAKNCAERRRRKAKVA
jgi:hypothetical protein